MADNHQQDAKALGRIHPVDPICLVFLNNIDARAVDEAANRPEQRSVKLTHLKLVAYPEIIVREEFGSD